MRALHTDRLILLPRICQAARNALDDKPNLQVSELSVKFTGVMKQMHSLLIQIMQSCLDQILIQYRWQVGKLEKMRNYARQQEMKSAVNNGSAANKSKSMELLDSHAEIVEQKDQIEELMTVESALLTTFDGQCRGVLG